MKRSAKTSCRTTSAASATVRVASAALFLAFFVPHSGRGAVPCAIGLAAGADAQPSAQPAPVAAGDDSVNVFSFPGEASIQEEVHCGIVNGLLAPGIPFKGLARVGGLWAPPYVSSDFTLNVTVLGQDVPAKRYAWWPFKVDRSAEVEGMRVSTATVLAAGKRAAILAVTVENTTPQAREVPLRCAVRGTLDRSDGGWGFHAPRSRSRAKPEVADGALLLRQATLAIAVRAVPEMAWDAAASSGGGVLKIGPGQQATQYLTLAIGKEDEAAADCRALAAGPAAAIRQADDDHRRQVREMFERLPRLESANPALAQWYTRSLVHFLMNRWDVPEFALHPFYGTGCTRGGCVCSYLWNYGETWEIMPLYEPKADREYIVQYLRNDMMAHLAIDPMTGKALGPWYPVGQTTWAVFQYDLVNGNRGVVQIMARDNNKDELVRLKLRGLDTAATYEINACNTMWGSGQPSLLGRTEPVGSATLGLAAQMSGKNLLDTGLALKLGKASQVIWIIYQKK